MNNLQEKIEALPKTIQNSINTILDILVHNYDVETKVKDNELLAIKLAEFILSTRDESLLKKIEKVIKEELYSQTSDWERREIEKELEKFKREDCISNEEVMANIEKIYGF
ncbi:MAG: hypothetical protein H7A25_23365 [Leptospiraceae bacterium]|nr:hypothetical protein [Leptospiraceae bacterium]MCP5502859.1 hypothetical protein [Leptospiraceae bacterium]